MCKLAVSEGLAVSESRCSADCDVSPYDIRTSRFWFNHRTTVLIEFTPYSSLAGGALIGIAAVLLLKFNGRIAGISGILNGALALKIDDRLWRVLFIVGIIIGGYLYQAVSGHSLITREAFSTSQLALAGLLVGFGTRVGGGCTSGHGVCGVARLSLRSVLATLSFLTVGMATASLVYFMSGRI